jgi:SAM-dependent methyltransferase
MHLAERLLLALSRDPRSADFSGATDQYTLANALDFAQSRIPDFLNLIRGRRVLDYGCGPGWQAVAMATAGARQVVGVDINEAWIAKALALARAEGCETHVQFVQARDADRVGQFDVTISLNSFEHFADPAWSLAQMRAATRPGGQIVIAFAEPWLSPRGSHMTFFTRVPWVNVLFSEETVMRVRSRFRSDGAMRYEDVESGLNKMTLRKFRHILRASGLPTTDTHNFPIKGLPLVAQMPLLQEFFTAAVSCNISVPLRTPMEQAARRKASRSRSRPLVNSASG